MGSSSIPNLSQLTTNHSLRPTQTTERNSDCFFRNKILSYIEDSLHPRMLSYMRRHLESCSVCQDSYSQVETMLNLISEAIPEEKIDEQTFADIQNDMKDLVTLFYKEFQNQRPVWWKRLVG